MGAVGIEASVNDLTRTSSRCLTVRGGNGSGWGRGDGVEDSFGNLSVECKTSQQMKSTNQSDSSRFPFPKSMITSVSLPMTHNYMLCPT